MTPVDPVASTALWMAAARARESARPDRLFDDRLAGALAGPEGRRIMDEMEAGMPDNPAIPIRTRYVDDGLLACVEAGRVGAVDDGLRMGAGPGGIGQVVLVAAGMDTRAYRLGLPAGVTVYELDRGELLDLKERRLAAAGARPGCGRRTVPADLGGAWSGDLVSAGFEVTRPAVFVAEGLLGYLDEPEVHRLLGTLSGLAADGSVLMADVSGRTPAAAAPYLAAWFDRLEAAGMGRRFATDDPEGLFAGHGWRAQVSQYGDDGAAFGRWPWPVPDRENMNWPHNYLITAYREPAT